MMSPLLFLSAVRHERGIGKAGETRPTPPVIPARSGRVGVARVQAG
jgi:hypothetical protein